MTESDDGEGPSSRRSFRTAPRRAYATARQVALTVLTRVARDGAYADRALDVALERSSLSERDKALATELVYGTLRRQLYLDFLIGELADRSFRKTPPVVRESLRLGAYQILETRVPPHAAVNEAVALVSQDYRHAAGFVNAVLRKLAVLVAENKLPEPANSPDEPWAGLAIKGGVAPWIVAELAAQRGAQAVEPWLAANNVRPPLSLRVCGHRTTRAALLHTFEGQGVEVEAPSAFPDGLRLVGAGNVADLPGFAEGHFVVQDLAAQLVARLAAPASGDRVWDVCAAPGGKAMHLAELVGPEGRVLASDLHAAKTRLISDTAQRLHLNNVTAVPLDATDEESVHETLARHGMPEVDVVVLDAPCTGLGTLRRNPELRIAHPEQMQELVGIQAKLLTSAATTVRAGGALIYAVCTFTRAEGPEQVAKFLTSHPEFVAELPTDPLLGAYLEEQHTLGQHFTALRTWTDRDGTDGFFGVRLCHRSGAR